MRLERSAELVGATPLHLLTQTALPLKSPTGAFIATLRSANAVAPNAKFKIIFPLNMASNDDDCRRRRKQGGVVGAAASKTRVPPKARSGCWEPQPVSSGGHLKLSCFPQTTRLRPLLQKIAFFANLCLTTGRLSDIIEHVPAVRCRTNLSDHGPVAQLVRAPACHAGGRRFEPDPGRHLLL